MKKTILAYVFGASLCALPAQTYAQKLSEIVTKARNEPQMSPVVSTFKTLIQDDASGYLREFGLHTYQTSDLKEITEVYTDFGLWKTNKSYFVGSFQVRTMKQNGKSLGAKTYQEGTAASLNLYFQDASGAIVDIFPREEVAAYFEAQLEKLQAKGAEGSEVLYAEIPRKGTSIKLFVVYASELEKNKGLPIWKLPIGELKFDKNTGTFTLVKG